MKQNKVLLNATIVQRERIYFYKYNYKNINGTHYGCVK